MNTKIVDLSAIPKDVTVEDVKQMESFKHLTDEQAAELLQFFDSLCDIAYSIWSKQQKKEQEASRSISGIKRQEQELTGNNRHQPARMGKNAARQPEFCSKAKSHAQDSSITSRKTQPFETDTLVGGKGNMGR